MRKTPTCPVCGMRVTRADNGLEYGHMHFWLCSEPCRLRFQDRPAAYVTATGGRGGDGAALVKRRRLRLGQTLRPDEGNLLRDLLEGMMGVRMVAARGDRLEITYDTALTGAEQLEAELAEAGDRLGGGWGDRLRRAFIHYEEETAG